MDGVTPVTAVFNPEGLVVISMKSNTAYQRVIPWKELYKLGLRGKKMTGNAVVKKVAQQVKKMVDSNVKSMVDHKKRMKELTDIRKRISQPRPSLPPMPPPPPPIAAAP